MGGGISTSQIPMHIDIETFRKLTGGTFNDPIFDDYAVDGVMSRDKLLELSLTTDCFLSFDRQQPDCHGRSTYTRAVRMQNALRARGIVCWLLEEQVHGATSDIAGAVFNANKNNISQICNGIDKARCVVCFVTSHYIQRVSQTSNTSDQCQVEFNYGVRQKFPSHIIAAVCDQPLVADARLWKGPVAKYLISAENGQSAAVSVSNSNSRGNSARGSTNNIFNTTPAQTQALPATSMNPNIIDVTSDDPELFDRQVDSLFKRIVEVTRAKHVREYFETPEVTPRPVVISKPNPVSQKGHAPLLQTQGLPPNATREDAQFFQWMARCCSNINHEKRVVYCAALEHRGVKTVHDLAARMQEDALYLMIAGISERDADDIALAVSDLGLGYVPVRDFSNATTIESAVYAMRKSCEAAGDSELGSNALASIARMTRADPANAPLSLAEAGCVEPVVKILARNLGHANCVVNAYLALQGLAVNDEICIKLGNVSACDVIPRALQSHLTDEKVVEEGCKLISMLARNPENNLKLGTAGACDVVMKGLLKHIANPGVAHYGCDAANKLAFGNFENVGKLGYHNACEALSTSISLHYQVPEVAEHALRAMHILGVEPENRARMGKLGACEGTINAIQHHIHDPVIVEYGLRLVTMLILGNANNRTKLGQLNATGTVMHVLEIYSSLRQRSQLLFPSQEKAGATNPLFGGSSAPANVPAEPPFVFDYPTILQFACTSTYTLAAGSPANQKALISSLPLLQAIFSASADYMNVANAKMLQKSNKRSVGSSYGVPLAVPNEEERRLFQEIDAMKKIQSEVKEAVQRVASV